jgi:predicted tellurium resistance membrane protein TerC
MEWFNWIGDPNAWVSLVTLTFLEIVLGIDNVNFISILAGKLPHAQHDQRNHQRQGCPDQRSIAASSREALAPLAYAK